MNICLHLVLHILSLSYGVLFCLSHSSFFHLFTYLLLLYTKFLELSHHYVNFVLRRRWRRWKKIKLTNAFCPFSNCRSRMLLFFFVLFQADSTICEYQTNKHDLKAHRASDYYWWNNMFCILDNNIIITFVYDLHSSLF